MFPGNAVYTGAAPGRQIGFGLIELVIAMVIIAVLSVIAIPAYQGYLDRTRRTVAVSALTELYTQQQQLASLSNRGSSAGVPTFARLTGIDEVAVCIDKSGRYTVCPGMDSLFRFEMLIDAGGGWGGIKATALGVQARDDTCQSLTLSAAGRQLAENGKGVDTSSECWR